MGQFAPGQQGLFSRLKDAFNGRSRRGPGANAPNPVRDAPDRVRATVTALGVSGR
ncbi:hypothetical protein SSAG_02360 [Streptomyces sp. Mg1]|nr:hypothetical protein SSAG_02360 [Streptomyces sp. Mg1]